VADVYPALEQQVFDVPQDEWEPQTHHLNQADD
jgi:hypothetical protein